MRVLLVVWWCVALAHAARILVVLPTNTRSHYAMYGRLVHALATKGHHLTVISHFPMKHPLKNINEINLAGTIPEITNNLSKYHNTFKPNFVLNLEQIIDACVRACTVVSKVPAVRELLNSTKKFDLVIAEVFGSDCFIPFGKRFQAPVVGLLSSVPLPWVNEHLGNPEATAYVPAYMMSFGQRMSLFERFLNTFAVIWARVLYKNKSQYPSQVIADHLFGPGSNLETMGRNYSLIISNSHFSINEVRPIVPTLIEVGGLHLDQSQALPKELRQILDTSINGVIYWSFGSMSRIETINAEKLTRIFGVFAELSQTILIKLDRRKLASNITVPANVFTMEWIPQYTTLCHPNLRLFITHGGLLGVQEAVACAVPMLTVPLFADQALNGRAMSDRGVARTISLTETNLNVSWNDALRDLLTNRKYKRNALRLKDIFLDRPLPPLETGVYWIEYVLKYKGAEHLRSPALDLHAHEQLLLDVIAISVVIALLTIFLIHALLRYLCTRCLKWWPKKKLMFEKRLFRKDRLVQLYLCLNRKYKIKNN